MTDTFEADIFVGYASESKSSLLIKIGKWALCPLSNS